MKNGEEPAYPVHGGKGDDPRNHTLTGGLTKREYFAAMAMKGLLSNPQYTQELKDNFKNSVITDMNLMCVREAIDMADELLKNLES